MNIRRWHWGKLVILWSWGGLIAALLMTRFLSQEVGIDPLTSTVSFLLAAAILLSVTVVTWVWLGGKDGAPSDR
jgi:hypothetical protein